MSNNLKYVGLGIAAVGVIFIILNFTAPHTVMVQETVQVPVQTSVPTEQALGSIGGFNLTGDAFEYFYPVNITAGATFNVSWSADNPLTAYIFTESQFNDFNATFPNTPTNYETVGSGDSGEISLGAQNTGYYVAALVSGVNTTSTTVNDFAMSEVANQTQTNYQTQTKNVPKADNLYNDLGVVLIFAGIMVYFVLSMIKSTKTPKASAAQPAPATPAQHLPPSSRCFTACR